MSVFETECRGFKSLRVHQISCSHSLNWIERRSTKPKAEGSNPSGCTSLSSLNQVTSSSREVRYDGFETIEDDEKLRGGGSIRGRANFMYAKCYGSTTGSNPVSVGSTPTAYANYGDCSSVG